MARIMIALVVTLALLAASASAQPCIACRDCQGSNACLARCQRECPVTVNVESCKNYGVAAGRDVANFACELVKKFCAGGQRSRSGPGLGYTPPTRVTLQQCANAAYGVCQTTAISPQSPCAWAFKGTGQCTEGDVKSFYAQIVDEQCNYKVAPFDQGNFGRKLL